MAIEQIKDADFQQSVLDSSNKQPVLVDFWAEWCGPCKALGPILENIASECEGKVAGKKINIDENPETAPKYGIRGIPTIMIFKNGELAATNVGVMSKSELTNFINDNA